MNPQAKLSPRQLHLEHDNQKANFGFWVYLMTDCVLFACLFVTYAVLRQGTFGGPGPAELFSLPLALVETILLLLSSFTAGMMVLSLPSRKKQRTIAWLLITLALGLMFLTLEIHEFSSLLSDGYSWTTNGFLSAFFVLVGTHGLHILIGLIWIIVMAWQVTRKGLTNANTRRLTTFGLYWHFLDVIWIFIFTIVYLMGSITL